MCFVKRHSTNL